MAATSGCDDDGTYWLFSTDAFSDLRGARVIAEAHAQQDQYESHPQALRVIALGRLVSIDGWRI